MKKATTPMTATPPATDKPTIEPVPRPESEEGGMGEAADELDGAAELVRVTVMSELLIVVRLGAAGASGVGVCDGGEDEEEVVVVDFEVLCVEAELTEVAVVVELVVVVVVPSVVEAVVVVVRPGGTRMLCAATT